MKPGLFWVTALGLGVVLPRLFHSAPASATDTQRLEASRATQKASAAQTQSTFADRPVGLVGTVVGVSPESRTLVVDVLLGTEVLRLGTELSEGTKFAAGGVATRLEELKEGDKVRIMYRRLESGDEAISVEVLDGRMG